MTATVNEQSITITDESLTVSESVGIYECDFSFDSSWDGWQKTAVFQGAGETIEMIVVDSRAQIPWEVLKEAGWMKIGVYGTKSGEVKPTIWSDQIYVSEGTVPESIEVTPTPSIYAQILDLANDAKDIAEDAQDTADDVASDWASVSATATTLSAGSPATVTFADNTFAFGIPKGAKGDTGATGATGATPDFSIGTVSTLETGQSATATITGTAAQPVLNLGLPKGNKGDNGDVANIADAYSTSATYAAGDYCIYNSQLYRCTTAISTAEAWTAAHWTAAELSEDVGDLRSAIREEIKVITDMTGLNYSPEITFIDGKGIKTANGQTGTDATRSYSGYIPILDGIQKVILTMLKFTSSTNYGIAFYSSNAASTFISGVRENYNADAYGVEVRSIDVPSGAKYFRTTWCDSSDDFYDEFTCRLYRDGTFTEAKVSAEIDEKTHVTTNNVLNPLGLTLDKYIRNDTGASGNSSIYAVTDYIAVRENDEILLTTGTQTHPALVYVAAYDEKKDIMGESGGAGISSGAFTVPSGVAFVRITAAKERITSRFARISLNGQNIRFETYYGGNVSGLARENHTEGQSILNYPLATLPRYILGSLAYRPLGVLSQGYICIVSDDGNADLANYTIPMMIAKGVPGSWAVMSDSEVFGTQAGIEAVVDSVENHGCCITQHGGSAWTNYDEMNLNAFFDNEKQFWDTLGLMVYGACPPTGVASDIIQAVCGGRFGCVRDGYAYGSQMVIYDSYINGPRSNIYGLTSQNCVDGNISGWQAQLDMVKEKHYLKMVHLHENELSTPERKAQLEAIIDYAKSISLTFITMKDIPTIT